MPQEKDIFSLPRFLSLLLISCWAWAMPAAAQSGNSAPEFVEKLADKELLDQVRKGGFVLYMRHGNTDNTRPDQVPLHLDDCQTQRPLNDEGRKVAATVGKAIAAARIPLAEIIHSPLCRARETAELAFPERLEQLRMDVNLMYTANLTTAEKQPVLAGTRRLLAMPVDKGSNRLIVAHAPNMADLIGYFVKPEGTVVVILPLGGDRFEYVASIHPAMWPQLLR